MKQEKEVSTVEKQIKDKKLRFDHHFSLKWNIVDIIIIIIFFVIGGFFSIYIYLMPTDPGSNVNIYYMGEELISLPLYDEEKSDPRYVILFKENETSEYDLIYQNNYKFSNLNNLIDDLIIEINDGGIEIVLETSPNHICSNQGRVTRPNITLTCAPNHVFALITSEGDGTGDVIV